MRNTCRGFTYIIVLVAVIVLGILAETATTLASHVVRADRETELLFRGQAYQRAIKSYYDAGVALKAYPRTLEELLNDPRFPNRHHIRALYPDPVAQGAHRDWLLIRAPDGGIQGVASNATDEPLKKANFPTGLEKFENAKTYSDWIFQYAPAATMAIPASRLAPFSPPNRAH